MATRTTRTLAVAVLPLLAMATVSCSSEKGEGGTASVPQLAQEVCDSSLSPAARKDFEKLFAGRKVEEASYSSNLTKVADELKQAKSDDVEACGVVLSDTTDRGMTIRFGWAYGLVSPSDTSETAFFSVGDQAYSDGRNAYTLVKCSASIPNLNPDEEHYLLARLNGPDSELPLAERQKLQVSLLYPVLRKTAGIVGCKEAADLPDSPSLSTTRAPQ
ncbi:hypothetical protein [Streptomyces sp. AS02]|uniref:hypothetical protein n=1 Tax=Streptomyces sp. AS02 TaxID=2938946 RepID=UPI00202133B8|nr:hypothetical protein [Streptomyces sp. AS02]MCL8016802.1 hypothetical protein [Streptomyces sp. AS02]